MKNRREAGHDLKQGSRPAEEPPYYISIPNYLIASPVAKRPCSAISWYMSAVFLLALSALPGWMLHFFTRPRIYRALRHYLGRFSV